MARESSKIICHICHKKGGFIGRRSDGTAGVQIPIDPDIKNISEAWDYAAKVCLRHREDAILYPKSAESDEKAARAVYKSFFTWFTLPTDEDIKSFELRHSSLTEWDKKYVDTKKAELTSTIKKTTEHNGEDDNYSSSVSNKLPATETRHTFLPVDAGRITKYSIAWLYAAIVCKTLSDVIHGFYPERYEYGVYYANAIYSFFSLFVSDLRYRKITLNWINKMIPDVQDYGYHAAASKNYIAKLEDTKVRFSSKHVKKKSKELLQKQQNMENFLNAYFLHFVLGFKNNIDNNPYIRKGFLDRFHEYEVEASNGALLRKNYYYIRHSEPNNSSDDNRGDISNNNNNNNDGDDDKDRIKKKNYKRTKRKRECRIEKHELAYVGIDDWRYPLYRVFINVAAKSILNRRGDRRKRGAYYGTAEVLLNLMGWPKKFIEDKIREDIKETIIQREKKLLLFSKIVPECTPRILSLIL